MVQQLALGVIFIDETAALQRAAAEHQDQELLYSPVNLHFTTAANVVVAQTIAERLKPLLHEQTTGSPASSPSLIH